MWFTPSVHAEPDAHDLGRLLIAPAVFVPSDGAKPVHRATFCGKGVEVLHHRCGLVGVNKGLNARPAERVDEVVYFLFPKEIVHLDLVLLAADAACPCAVGFACTLWEGENRSLVLFVPGFQFLAVPAEGVDDLLLAVLPFDLCLFPCVADALHLFKIAVVRVHHGGYPPFVLVCTYITLNDDNSKLFL
ncbi:hypothetical protein BW28_05930 [Clostridioides difficile]|nr:hypothetical protein BW28_05930 [Clostridioides difficile]